MSGFIASSIASSSRRRIASVRPSGVISKGISTTPSAHLDLAPAGTNSVEPPAAAALTQSRVQLLSFPKLTPLPRPHGIHVASLHLAAHHPYPLDLYTSFSLHAAHSLGIPTSNPASLPTVTSLYTVPKSPFVHKKSQENFERRNHRRVIKVWDADRGAIDLWLRYLRRNGVGGVGMRAEVFEWVEVGEVGKELGALGEKMQKAAEGMGREVEEKAEQLKKEFSEKAEEQSGEKETEEQSGGEKEAEVKQEERENVKKVEETVDGA